jgi:hypothetical protein
VEDYPLAENNSIAAALIPNKLRLFPVLGQRPKTLAAACGLLVMLTALPAHAQTCAPPPSPGMVAWWPLDETGGTAISDRTGQNPGTASAPIGSGGVQSFPGFVGKGLNFHFQGRVTVNPSSTLDFGTNKSFTIDAWIKGHASPIVSNVSSTQVGYSVFFGNDGKLRLDMGVGSALLMSWPGPPITPGAWTFVAVVVDRTTQKVTLYTADPGTGNALATSGPLSIPNNANAGIGLPLKIGGCPGNPNGCDTIIDELEIYDRPLTQQELQSIVNAGSAGKCVRKGMTWIHTASNAQTGTITVGCSGCDAHQGDTVCTQPLPLLCIYKPTPPFSKPAGVITIPPPYNDTDSG